MWFSGFFFLILSLIVEVYLWWKLQASLIFLSGRTCTIGGWLNTFLPHCIYTHTHTYTQPKWRNCWDVFLYLNKLKDFQITWANVLFTIEHREHQCLNWEMLPHYPLNELISNLKPATGLKKVGKGATKVCKSKTFWKDLAGRTSSNWLS